MRPRSLAVVVSSLGFGFGCGQAPTRETPTPTPAPPSLTTFAYAETDVPGTLRVFDVDDETGALRTRIDVTPSGTEQAPVVSPGSFAVDPNGRFLFYSYDSCRGGFCGNVSSYEILPDGGLRLLVHDGPESLEAGIEVFFATASRLVTHWDDPPWHSLTFYDFDGYGGLKRNGGIFLGYGYGNVPRRFELTRNGRWGYGLTTGRLVSYRLDERPGNLETSTQTLPAPGRGLEMDTRERLLYVSLQTTPPRIDVYGISDAGLGSVVGTTPVGEAGPLLLDPTERLLFLGGSAGIEIYSVDPGTGLLLPRGREPVDGLDGLSVHPFGTFLYASLEDGSLRGYAIDPSTGALSDIGLGARGRRLQFARVPATTGRGGA